MKSHLKVLRAEKDWTQETLASRVGVSRYAINALETERHNPSLDLAFRLAAEFDVEVEAVFPNPLRQKGASTTSPNEDGD